MRGTLSFYWQTHTPHYDDRIGVWWDRNALRRLQPCRGADDTIKIGVVLPTTGSESKPGQYQKEGIELAIKQINDAGGIMVKSKGKKLKIEEVFYDDGIRLQKVCLADRAGHEFRWRCRRFRRLFHRTGHR